jgi:hypothetical protein
LYRTWYADYAGRPGRDFYWALGGRPSGLGPEPALPAITNPSPRRPLPLSPNPTAAPLDPAATTLPARRRPPRACRLRAPSGPRKRRGPS